MLASTADIIDVMRIITTAIITIIATTATTTITATTVAITVIATMATTTIIAFTVVTIIGIGNTWTARSFQHWERPQPVRPFS